MRKIDNSSLYLLVTVVSVVILPISLGASNKDISYFTLNSNLAWIPFWILVLCLPFYGIIQITKLTDEIPIKFWIGLLINLISFILILRFFSIEIFPS